MYISEDILGAGVNASGTKDAATVIFGEDPDDSMALAGITSIEEISEDLRNEISEWVLDVVKSNTSLWDFRKEIYDDAEKFIQLEYKQDDDPADAGKKFSGKIYFRIDIADLDLSRFEDFQDIDDILMELELNCEVNSEGILETRVVYFGGKR